MNRAKMPGIDVLCESRDAVGESPLWSAAEQALYWVDIEGRSVRRFDWRDRALRSWRVAERVGCIVLGGEAGTLVAAMESGVFDLVLGDGTDAQASLLQSIDFPLTGMRFNDGRCDREGRFWVTSMVMDMALASPAGALHRLARADIAAGLRAPVVAGLVTGNGLAFSPDNRRMYLSDSHPSVQRVWSFDVDGDGNATNRREFVDMNRHPGRPDGAAVDADGCYWSCANDAGLVHRFTPEGRLDRSIAVPASKPSMCAFGGPDLATLFITSIRPARPEPLAGAVFATRPGVGGIAEQPFVPVTPAA